MKNINNETEFENHIREDILNSIIYNISFKPEFHSANKSILKHISDLKPITEGFFEEKKLGINQREYECLYHPNHPLRYAMETLDSIEEERIIKKALK